MAAGAPNLVLDGPSFAAHHYNQYKETDGFAFIGAESLKTIGGTYTLTRVANGLLSLVKTNAADTTRILAYLNVDAGVQKIGADPLAPGTPNIVITQSREMRGSRLKQLAFYYQIGTASLTSLTPLIWRSIFADNVAVPTPTNPAGALTPTILTPTFRANMYAQVVTLATPFVLGNNIAGVSDMLELTAVDPGGGGQAFQIFGIGLIFDYNLL